MVNITLMVLLLYRIKIYQKCRCEIWFMDMVVLLLLWPILSECWGWGSFHFQKGCHDITEILLKVALNTITNPNHFQKGILDRNIYQIWPFENRAFTVYLLSPHQQSCEGIWVILQYWCMIWDIHTIF